MTFKKMSTAAITDTTKTEVIKTTQLPTKPITQTSTVKPTTAITP
ncbi:hypothetical protein [Wolbachia pipientis]|nr:hypothetical protein [Wolbachia pipientis]MDM8335496.1 hypothetical protein [Wolbachia pipientis]